MADDQHVTIGHSHAVSSLLGVMCDCHYASREILSPSTMLWGARSCGLARPGGEQGKGHANGRALS